jgi:hypothetical protein
LSLVDNVLTLSHVHTEYIISVPNMYACGIFFGKTILELGDMCYAKNKKLGVNAEMEFKTKVGVLLITALSPYPSYVELTFMLSVSCCAGLFPRDVTTRSLARSRIRSLKSVRSGSGGPTRWSLS